MLPLISIIMPAYNSGKYIKDSIQSVIDQEYDNWELFVINDGSTDNTLNVIESFTDSRITVFNQPNKGVSEARNVGLTKMKGDYFCFLDADDCYFKESLSLRVDKFSQNENLCFVDGAVVRKDSKMDVTLSEWVPSFRGNPLKDLVSLTGKSFLGLTWMVKRDHNLTYRMKENLTHGEDLLFYINLSKNGKHYDFIDNPILKYRIHNESAMHNLERLDKGYKEIFEELKKNKKVSSRELKKFKSKTRSIMFKSFLAQGNVLKALKSFL